MFRPLTDLFRRRDGRPAWPVIVAFALLNLAVLVNNVLHDPRVGYDAGGHRTYVRILSEGRLPTFEETHEFFSPPLPYLPSVIGRLALGANAHDGDRWRTDGALKIGQLAQAGYSVVLTLALLAIVRIIRPRDAFARFVALLCLGMLPVYYRSFAMIRGEPLLATLVTLGLFLTLRTFAIRRPTLRAAALVGAVCGAACISRQWGFFVLPGLALVGVWRLIVDVPNRVATLRAGVVAMLVAGIVGGPFYVYLRVRFGKVSTFNRTANSLTAHDAMIKTTDTPDDDVASAAAPIDPPTSLTTALRAVVTMPLRDRLADHRVMLFYVDAFGDYWQYYLFDASEKHGKRILPGRIGDASMQPGVHSNYASMSAYLGRVSVVSIVPTLALLVGCGAAVASIRRVRRDAGSVALPTVGVLIVSSAAGYVWFVTSYLGDHADTVKATYCLQIYPMLAIATAAWLAHVRDRMPRVAWSIVGVLLIVLAHNAPACFTRTLQAW